MTQKTVTVILPCYNEEHYIGNVIKNILSQDYPAAEMEIYIVDGMSIDRTRDIVRDFMKTNPSIELLENPHKIVPYALNKAISKSTGKYIIRFDAHTEYAKNYISKCLETFERTGAEIVGGPMRAIGKTAFQRAVAVCTSTSFGVGDSKFHDEHYSGYVDSVYLGAWRRDIFKTVGMFDEQMVRNQDDEFHYRAKSLGMKIYLNSEIHSRYYPRSSFKSLFKQYFQYGLFKPLVLKKVKSEIKLRHLIPSGFVLYLLFALILFPLIKWISVVPALLYALGDLYFSISKQDRISEKLFALIIYPTLHISYGAGFLLGLTKSKHPSNQT